jgi:hypothetical protein
MSLTRHNIVLYDGDMEKMKEYYPNRASLIIRELVRRHLVERASSAPNIVISLEKPSE